MANHRIVHVELSAKDRKALSEFYKNIFGWQIQHYDDMNYTTFEAGEGSRGGFNPVSEQNPMGTVTVYIETDDVPATLNEVEKAGGTITMKETEIPNTGKFGMFRDPQGNMVGLFKPYPG